MTRRERGLAVSDRAERKTQQLVLDRRDLESLADRRRDRVAVGEANGVLSDELAGRLALETTRLQETVSDENPTRLAADRYPQRVRSMAVPHRDEASRRVGLRRADEERQPSERPKPDRSVDAIAEERHSGVAVAGKFNRLVVAHALALHAADDDALKKVSLCEEEHDEGNNGNQGRNGKKLIEWRLLLPVRRSGIGDHLPDLEVECQRIVVRFIEVDERTEIVVPLAHEREDRHSPDRRQRHRQDNPPVGLERVASVDLRRIVVLARNRKEKLT